MAKIFISYNRQSEPIVRSLANDIESLGHSVWFDHELSGGQAWWDQILATVRDCAVFVFVLSPEGLNSTACKREYTYASELGKPVLPVLVSDGVSINLLPPALSKIEFIDYRKQDRDAAFRLARALSAIPPANPLPDPLPKPPDAPISYLGSLTEQVDSASTLSYQEQTALLVDLKRSLRDQESTEDARTLLQKLRKRRDLFATIAEDIDELLGSVGNPVQKKVHVDPRPVDQDQHSVYDEHQSNSPQLKRAGNLSILDDKHGQENPVLETHDSELTTKARLIGAGIGAVAGLVCSLPLFDGHHPAINIGFLISGAIAGAISGTNGKRIFGSLLGVIVAVIFVANNRAVEQRLVALLAPPLGAVVCKLITRKKH